MNIFNIFIVFLDVLMFLLLFALLFVMYKTGQLLLPAFIVALLMGFCVPLPFFRL